jgi:hypothetical protein
VADGASWMILYKNKGYPPVGESVDRWLMDARTITNVLLVIIILILVYRWFYPVWKKSQARKADEKQERMRKEVERFYQEYLQKRKALRTKYDPERKLLEF